MNIEKTFVSFNNSFYIGYEYFYIHNLIMNNKFEYSEPLIVLVAFLVAAAIVY